MAGMTTGDALARPGAGDRVARRAPGRATLRRAGVGVAVCAVAVAVGAGVAWHVRGAGGPLTEGVTDWWLTWLAAGVGYSAAGAWLALARPALPVGWLLLAVGVLSGASFAGVEYGVGGLLDGTPPGAAAAFWLANWVWVVALLLLGGVLPLLLPAVTPAVARRLPALWVAVAAVVVAAVDWALRPYGDWSPVLAAAGVDNPVGVEALGSPALRVALTAAVVAGPVAGVAGLVARWRASSGDERRQLKWVLYGLALSVLLFAAGFAFGPVLTALAVLPLPAGCAIAVLRHGLWDVDVVISRSLAFGALTTCVVAAYVGIVGALGGVLGRTTGAPIVATAVVAVLVEPLHRRLRRSVNRVVHGDADDPLTALSRLGERVGSAADAATVGDRVLPELLAAVVRTLRLRHAAVELVDGTRVSEGSAGDAVETLPLVYTGRTVGALVVTPRGDGLGRGDRLLLARLARQVAVAAHALVLAHEVARSREHVVAVREEERRRLYRDLHDGLGPSLAALALTVETARDVVPEEPDRAVALLDRALPRLRGTIDDVRAVVNGLRPPALDDLGLAGALTELATRFGAGPEVVVDVEVDDGLAAATEVAAYRIVAEALANATRHAAAARVTVRVRRDGRLLRLAVTDDGRGIGPDAREDGVGLVSMRARAEEIGGGLVIDASPGGGTRVRAWLPVGAP